MKRVAFTLIAYALPTIAAAQATCEDRLAEIDERIASGNYPDQNVQLAKTMRNSMAQMCGMLDEQTLDHMMEGFEDVLPVKSAEEKLAERQEKKKIAEESRTARKAAAESRKAATPDSGLSTVAGAGRSVASGFVDRDEDMLRFWTWDWDVHNGNARVLYETRPSRVQLGRPDWQTYVYVVETTPDGRSTQHLVTSKQAQENVTLALRRGHDEVLLQRQVGQDETSTTLERWSISGRNLISSVPTPVAPLPEGKEMPLLPLRGPTSDGNLLFVGAFAPQPGSRSAVWYEASPDGSPLGSGTLPIGNGGFTNLSLVTTNNGGGALPVMFEKNEEVVSQIGSAQVKAAVMKETRILTIGDDGAAHQSAVIGRFVMPAQMDIASMQYMSELEHELMANRSIESLDVGPRTEPMIQGLGDSYVVLNKFSGDRNRATPVNGHWLVWVGRKKIEREVYLNPLAEDLNVDFVTIAVTPDEEIVLYGNSRKHTGTDYVVLLDKDGRPKTTAAVAQPRNGKIEGLLADDKGVWLFGHGYPTDEFSRFRFWYERIDFR